MSRAGRDDFSKKTVELLARRAGGKCAICGCATWGPNDKPYTATNIGQAAHISAAAEGGPRYNPSMTPEYRSSIKNGLWLCSNCHDKVDRNVETYSVTVLKELKTQAEARAREELGVPSKKPLECTPKGDLLSQTISGAAIIEIKKLKAQLTTYHTRKISLDEAKKILASIDFIDFNELHFLPEVGKEVTDLLERLMGYTSDVAIKLDIIRYLSDIVNHYWLSWGQEDVEEFCGIIKNLMIEFSPRQPVYQSAFALLKDLNHKMTKSDPLIRKIINDCLTEVVPKQQGGLRFVSMRGQITGVTRGQTLGATRGPRLVPRRGHESIDFDEVPEKRIRLEENDDEDVKTYLRRMTELTEKDPNDTGINRIEQDIIDLGFDSNIL